MLQIRMIFIKSIFLKPYISIKQKLDSILLSMSHVLAKLETIQEALGRVESRQYDGLSSNKINDYEFKVYSQWGEDGIIQYLIKNIEMPRKIFVEFGVENYTECNTRFLLVNNNWSGLIIEGKQEHTDSIKRSSLYWRYNLKAINSFVTAENIDEILESNGLSGEIGVLSIDVDGNDYWIWKAISVSQPIIVVIEYNYRFGIDKAVSTPYDPWFDREKKHHSMIYFGASLKALFLLGQKKGYDFVGCSNNGVNAFFVRKDKKPDFIRNLSVKEGYRKGGFSEYRNIERVQENIGSDQEIDLLNYGLGLPIVEVIDENIV